MCGVSEHVYVQEFRDIVMSRVRVLLLERRPYRGRLFLNERPLVREGLMQIQSASLVEYDDVEYLAGANRLDESCKVGKQTRQVHPKFYIPLRLWYGMLSGDDGSRCAPRVSVLSVGEELGEGESRARLSALPD